MTACAHLNLQRDVYSNSRESYSRIVCKDCGLVLRPAVAKARAEVEPRFKGKTDNA